MITDLIDTSIEVTSPYQYNNRCVPRVTEILSAMLHEDYLMVWSNNIGLYQRKKYKETLDSYADIGSMVHEAIDHFIKYGEDPEFLTTKNAPLEVIHAYLSFKEWWNIIIKNQYRVIYNEKVLICKYFGGTLDLLIEINKKIYLVDFKTSNHPSYKYTLQLSAYMYILNELYNIKVDGCIILMLSKKKVEFTEILYNFEKPQNVEYFQYCQETFLSLVYAYYNRIRIEQMYQILGG